MARPRSFEAGDVLDRAAEVFRSKGFEGASLPDLERATGLGRASLYGAFHDKRSLYLAALRRCDVKRAAALVARLDAEPSGLRAIRRLFETIVDECAKDPHGCLIANAAVSDPAAARCVSDNRRRVEGAIHAALLRGRADGSVKGRRDPRAAARFLFGTMAGLRTLSKAGCNRAQLREVVDLSLEAL